MAQKENIIQFNLDKPPTKDHIEGELSKMEVTYLETQYLEKALRLCIAHLKLVPDSIIFVPDEADYATLAALNEDNVIVLENVLSKLKDLQAGYLKS